LGREFFRTRVTSYHAGTFEDAVIFVHDVANGLAQLGGFEHKLIARIALQDTLAAILLRRLGLPEEPMPEPRVTKDSEATASASEDVLE
jgi:hypothetical protein